MKLKPRVTIQVISAAIVPLLLMVFLTVQKFSQEKHENTLTIIGLTLEKAAFELSAYFSARMAEVSAYSATEILSEMNMSTAKPFLNKELDRLQNHYEKFILGYPNGHFGNTSGGNPHFGLLQTFDNSAPDAKPRSIHMRDYWKATVGNNDNAEIVTYVSEPMISYTTEVKQIVVASSIHKDGKVVGMLGGALPWENIERRIHAINNHFGNMLADKGKLFLISPNGLYWYHWDEKNVVHLKKDTNGHFLLNEIGEKMAALTYIQDDENFKNNEHMINTLLNEANGVFILDQVNGIGPSYLLFQKVASSDYILGLYVPTNIVTESVDQVRNYLIGLASIVLCILVLISFLVGHRIASPIQALSTVAHNIRERRPVAKIEPKTKDEIHQLYKDIFAMLEVLEKNEQALEVRVQQRTMELYEKTIQLEQIKEEAISASKSKSLFLASMSHELRTPLNSIIGFTTRTLKYIKKGQLDRTEEALNTVYKNATHLLDLINQILDISKIEAGKIELNKLNFNILDLVRECHRWTEPLLESKGLTLNTNIQWKGDITADKLRLKQVLINLLSNAIKFTNEGSITCETLLVERNDKSFVCLAISDTGIGIKPDDLSKLFKKFSQLDHSHKITGSEGTGLGLAISKQLIELHGGTIEVESEYRKGSCFRVYLPLAEIDTSTNGNIRMNANK